MSSARTVSEPGPPEESEYLRLCWSPRRRHPYLWFAIPVGLALLVLSSAGVVTMARAGNLLVLALVLATLGLGVMMAWSIAMAICGREELSMDSDMLCRRRCIGGFGFRICVPSRAIVDAIVDHMGPGHVFWPGEAGPYLALRLHDRSRPLAIGSGMQLEADELRQLAERIQARAGA